ncbi:ABC transporter permease [Aestuariivirga litoralis]|uniref:ABC transporter permease n=1 Tax=Aestuariivirga litoralis TaxID=2650924 RepID=UPI0018C699E7|nr:ABC transporter permease [Aestuariivirga litoralis]MBG1233452.1 ABC transporter permease [Aestuariivirga litoralis]
MSSLKRLLAMIIKETRQLSRDPLTMAMMFAMPVMQLVLFGYAINSDPKSLPAAVLSYDHSPLSRAIIRSLGNTGYFAASREVNSEEEANTLMQAGEVQFIITIPDQFFRSLVRREQVAIDVEADATDPATVAPAIAAVNGAIAQVLATELTGPLLTLRPQAQPVNVILQRRYNPEGLTRFNIVPGLLGVILTMTMVMMTALAVTREYERGTMENLLAMPVKPLEVMIGKIAPYVMIGTVQVLVILGASKLLFNVPFLGSVPLFAVATLLFISVSLAIGFTFSTVARNQLQAMQMSFFFMLPSILLSGFAFPFRGMPFWAQALGECIPVTHFIRITRGLMLKGASFTQMAPEIAVLALTLVIVSAVAISRYRVTLD